jgi:hypothetical protein
MFLQKVNNAVEDRKDLVIKFGAAIILLSVLTIITREDLSIYFGLGLFVFLVWMLAEIIYEATHWTKITAIPVKSYYRRLNQSGAFMKLNSEFQTAAELDISGHEWVAKGMAFPINRNELVKKYRHK